MNMHKGEKSNKCNLCDFASTRTDHLRTHMKTHSGEKPNKCHLCEYSCIEPGTLWAHIKTHNGENLTNAINVIL